MNKHRFRCQCCRKETPFDKHRRHKAERKNKGRVSILEPPDLTEIAETESGRGDLNTRPLAPQARR